jgi:hypothetical protein
MNGPMFRHHIGPLREVRLCFTKRRLGRWIHTRFQATDCHYTDMHCYFKIVVEIEPPVLK